MKDSRDFTRRKRKFLYPYCAVNIRREIRDSRWIESNGGEREETKERGATTRSYFILFLLPLVILLLLHFSVNRF